MTLNRICGAVVLAAMALVVLGCEKQIREVRAPDAPVTPAPRIALRLA